MKMAVGILAAVTFFSLAEAFLLLSILLGPYAAAPRGYQMTVVFSQFLLIPGLAALFSRIIYGPHCWRRRLVSFLCVGLLGPFVALFLVAVVVAGVLWAASVHMALFVLISLVLGVAITFAIRQLIRLAGPARTELAVTQWLAERRSGLGLRERAWRNRAVRLASWVPVVIVSAVFLFLPEVWGAITQLRFSVANLNGYRVPLPAGWVVLDIDNWEPHEASVTGLAGHGIGRSFRPYLHGRLPLSSWSIRIYRPSQAGAEPPRNYEILDRRAFVIGREEVTCVQYRSTFPDWGIDPPASVAVRCSSGHGFAAGFFGESADLPAFYHMLENTVLAQ
jgi:hypothetical protein